jgi:tetratricopeptide (TPR) repeat protein
MGNYDAALVKFEAALAFQQEHGDPEKIRIARWCIARTLRSMGRLEDALALQRELEKGKDDGYVWEEIAEILLAQGEVSASKPYFHRAHAELSMDPWLVANEAARIERLRDLGHE